MAIVFQHPRVALLRRVAIFRGLSDQVLTALAQQMTLERYDAGNILLNQGQLARSFYVVYRGTAKQSLFGDSGREITLNQLSPGDFFGETSLFSGEVYSHSVVALEDVVLLALDGENFLKMLTDYPSVSRELLTTFSQRQRRNEELVGNLALQDVNARLTKTLADLARKHGEEQENGLLLRERPTQQALANMVGTCRETISRALTSMERKGLLQLSGRDKMMISFTLLGDVRQAA